MTTKKPQLEWLNSVSLAQGAILSQIKKYLRLVREQDSIDPKFIAEVEQTQGYCHGISALWGYSKWMQYKNIVSTKDNIVDDYYWFAAMVKAIIAWDGTKESLSNDIDIAYPAAMSGEQAVVTLKNFGAEFNRFIAYIEMLQNPSTYLPAIAQTDIDTSMQYSVKKVIKEDKSMPAQIDSEAVTHEFPSPKKVFSLITLLGAEQLKLLLESEAIKNGELVILGCYSHAIGLFKNGDNYYYFDPNYDQGERCYTKAQLGDLAQIIVASRQKAHTEYRSIDGAIPFILSMFSMEPEALKRTNQQEVLLEIKSPQCIMSSNQLSSEVELAIKNAQNNHDEPEAKEEELKIACIMHERLLRMDKSQDLAKYPPIYCALTKGPIEVASVYAAWDDFSNFDINYQWLEKNNMTLLILAVVKCDALTVEGLIRHGADIMKKTTLDNTALDIVIKKLDSTPNINELVRIARALLQKELNLSLLQQYPDIYALAATKNPILAMSLLREDLQILGVSDQFKNTETEESKELLNILREQGRQKAICYLVDKIKDKQLKTTINKYNIMELSKLLESVFEKQKTRDELKILTETICNNATEDNKCIVFDDMM